MAFTGKVVLVTGASSGIGEATAIHFAKLGASLSLTGRNVENLNKVGAECEKRGKVKPLLTAGDLTKEDFVKTLIKATVKHFGRLDVLVNNAGASRRGYLQDSTLEDFDYTFNTDVRSVYHLTSLAVPYLIKSKGNIVNVSSFAGLRLLPELLAYSMAKAALDQFTKCIALELAPKGVRVNSVNPGVINTPIHSSNGRTEADAKAYLERSAVTHPLGRYGESDEVAKAIAFFASEDASFTTGAIFPIDGGKHAACPR